MGVHGREREQAAIADLLTQARAGHGGSLVLTAEAGAGKTALLAEAAQGARAAGDMTVVATTPAGLARSWRRMRDSNPRGR
jgi:predicted ATPase